MKKLGFGCMRLPMADGGANDSGVIDIEQCKRMTDMFLDAGFCYFDTAHGYMSGRSEETLRECLTSRYPRNAYILTDKLTANYFKCEADIRPLFAEQLEKAGVEYFDYYLVHSVTVDSYRKFTECNAFAALKEFKAEGRIKHIGISFHDKPELLEKVLLEHPEIEVVQIQLNYFDYDNPSVESYAVYKVCEKYDKEVIVMEPCKGGGLINLPDECKATLDALHGGSYASYAIRYAASFPSVFMVLSGMSSVEQIRDNMSFMSDFAPFTDAEYDAVARVREVLKHQDTIQCTACRYCVAGCPKGILIPDLMSCYNNKQQFKDWNSDFYYEVNTNGHSKASDCIRCGKCESVCPQHLKIRELLVKIAETFEKKEK